MIELEAMWITIATVAFVILLQAILIIVWLIKSIAQRKARKQDAEEQAAIEQNKIEVKQ